MVTFWDFFSNYHRRQFLLAESLVFTKMFAHKVKGHFYSLLAFFWDFLKAELQNVLFSCCWFFCLRSTILQSARSRNYPNSAKKSIKMLFWSFYAINRKRIFFSSEPYVFKKTGLDPTPWLPYKVRKKRRELVFLRKIIKENQNDRVRPGFSDRPVFSVLCLSWC